MVWYKCLCVVDWLCQGDIVCCPNVHCSLLYLVVSFHNHMSTPLSSLDVSHCNPILFYTTIHT